MSAPQVKSPVAKIQKYDGANLRCARLILLQREKYDTPTSGCMIIWAEMVIRRLGPNPKGEIIIAA